MVLLYSCSTFSTERNSVYTYKDKRTKYVATDYEIHLREKVQQVKMPVKYLLLPSFFPLFSFFSLLFYQFFYYDYYVGIITLVSHHSGLSSQWFLITVVFHRSGFSSQWSFITVVFCQGCNCTLFRGHATSSGPIVVVHVSMAFRIRHKVIALLGAHASDSSAV